MASEILQTLERLVLGERVLVAWQADEGTGTIGTVVRAFDRSLAPIGGDRPLTTTRLGEPVLGTTWMPELHPRGEDGFLLVGSRGVEALSTFQVFLQALDADGEASGETVEPASVEGAAQSTPTMLALGDELHLAWVQEPQMGNAQGVYLAPGAEAPAPCSGRVTRCAGRALASWRGPPAQRTPSTRPCATASRMRPRWWDPDCCAWRATAGWSWSR